MGSQVRHQRTPFGSVQIGSSVQKVLVLLVDETIWKLKRMPFGLTSAPWIFTRLVRDEEVAKEARYPMQVVHR